PRPRLWTRGLPDFPARLSRTWHRQGRGLKQRKIGRCTPLTVIRDPCTGSKEGFDQLHIGLAIPIENVVVPPLVEDVERFRVRGRGIEQFRVMYMDQLVVPSVQHQRATLKTTQFCGIVKMALQL